MISSTLTYVMQPVIGAETDFENRVKSILRAFFGNFGPQRSNKGRKIAFGLVEKTFMNSEYCKTFTFAENQH